MIELDPLGKLGQVFDKCMFTITEHRKLTRQQEKMKELGAITTVCLDHNHGKTKKELYKCLKTEAAKHV